MPDDVTNKLSAAVTAAINAGEVREYFATSGITEGDVPLDGLKGFISAEVQKWGGIAESAKAKAD